MQGARRGTRSRGSRIRPWAEGSAKPPSHPGCPGISSFNTYTVQGAITSASDVLTLGSHSIPGAGPITNPFYRREN